MENVGDFDCMKIKKMLLSIAAVGCLSASAIAQDIPDWVKRMKVSGDFSVRTEFDTGERQSGGQDRVRERGRFRLGVDTSFSDKMKVNFGIETAGTNPTSAWTDFQDFQKPGLALSHAYMQYAPASQFTLSAGLLKSDIPYWKPVQFVWKSDVNPFGIAANINLKASDKATFFINAAALATTAHVDRWNPESADTPMSAIAIIQPGFDVKSGNTSFKGAFAIQHYGMADNASTGFLSANNRSYTLINPGWELTFAKLGGTNIGFTFNGELSKNVNDADGLVKEDTLGYMLQGGFGTPSVRAAKDWQIKAAYRYLELNAIPRGMGQTSAYGGIPDSKGYELFVGYGLIRNLAFNGTFYIMTNIDGNVPEKVSQFDLVYRF